MTAADKFGIAFSIGVTVALLGFAMSFMAMSNAPTESSQTATPPTPAPPVEEEPAMEETSEEETPAEEEPAMEETSEEEEEPMAEEEVAEEEVEEEEVTDEETTAEEEYEVAMSADVSIPSGSATPGCEETDECFVPSTVEIGVGGTVTWTNDDTAAHTVTSGTMEESESVGATFDSSILMAGKTFEHTFDEAGEYDYFCVVHPWMTGKVIVE